MMDIKRSAGLLLPLAALPGNHGIGDMSAAYTCIDFCERSGIQIWQILPLHPLGYGNSPYQPFSSYAGEPLYISLDLLHEEGLLNTVPDPYESEIVDYEAVKTTKLLYLKQAYQQFTETDQSEFRRFCEETPWLRDYVLFMALKDQYQQQSWIHWSVEDKACFLEKAWPSKHDESMKYYAFLQYLFFKQWSALKQYASDHHITILGDMPIYVGIDSADVWTAQANFQLHHDGRPTWIAGVPPDYFSETGQRWGNPIYDWHYLKQHQYQFWVDRLRWAMKLYDVIRIDHFRGFDSYWQIPAESMTAKYGMWVDGPGTDLFDELYKQLPDLEIIAEDLGDLRPSVLELRDHYQLRGMEVMQFLMDDLEDLKEHLHKRHLLLYSGTHDNPTLCEWLDTRDEETIEKLMEYFNATDIDVLADQILQTTLQAEAEIAIIPAQDLLHLHKEGRMNTPSTIGSPNWEWHLHCWDDLYACEYNLKTWLINSKRTS